MRRREICRTIVKLSIILTLARVQAQEYYPKDYFRNPLNLPLTCSGTFGELRPNHFHGGIDLRTGGKIGEKVYAAAEGYVSRIKISAWGGGKMLYITHPNGYKTVYMHLNDYSGAIGAWVKRYQEEHQVYAFDQKIAPGVLNVAKGEVVAHTGNTGASGGPHLHFEIRKSDDDRQINPLYFGFRYTDNIAPKIKGIRLYTENGEAVNVKLAPSQESYSKSAHKRQDTEQRWNEAEATDTITVYGAFYTGIWATDMAEGWTMNNGITEIELTVDGIPYWHYNASSYRIEDIRAINAIIDYAHHQATRQGYILTRQLPGCPLSKEMIGTSYLSEIKRHMANTSQMKAEEGWLSFAEGSTHRLEYRVWDGKSNYTHHAFVVKGGPKIGAILRKEKGEIDYHKSWTKQTKRYTIELPANILYDDETLAIQSRTVSGYYSEVLEIEPTLNPIPPHRAYTIKMLIDEGYRKMAGLTVVNIHGGKISAVATTRHGDTLIAHPKTWGSFAIGCDTTPPKLTWQTAWKREQQRKGTGKPTTRQIVGTERVKMTDNLSGIEHYACYIDNKWVLGEYDGKTATISIRLDGKAKRGSLLKVEATDCCGNKTEIRKVLH